MNIFTFDGNIGQDVDVREAGGTTLAEFSVAARSGFGDKEETLWIRCQLWGKRAESGLVEYLTKGKQVFVSGELQRNDWTNSDGESRTTLNLRVNEVTLAGGNAKKDPAGYNTKQTKDESPEPDNFDDDVPW